MPINRGLATRYPRLGAISAGFQAKSKKTSKIVPYKAKTLVFHSDDPARLAVLAEMYGGEVLRSDTATEDQEKFYLVSTTAELPVLLPSTEDSDKVCSQYYEMWASSGLVRRCDGNDTIAWRKPPDKKKDELVGDISTAIRPCMCMEEGLDVDKSCKPTVRLNVLPADAYLDIPDVGVWTVRSTGWASNTELKSDLELIRNMIGTIGVGVRLVLKIVQIRSKHGDVPMLRLGLEGTPRQAMEMAARAAPPELAGAQFAPPELDSPVGSFVDASEPTEDSEPEEAVLSESEEPTGSPQTPGGLGAQAKLLNAGDDLQAARDALDLLIAGHDVTIENVLNLCMTRFKKHDLDDLNPAEIRTVMAVVERTPKKDKASA